MSDLVPSPRQNPLAPRAEVVSPTEAVQSSKDDLLSLQTFLRLLVRRRWLILATTVTVALLAVVQLFTTTSLYTSVATLQIDPEDPNILPYEEISTSSSAQRATRAYLETQLQNLQTRSLARRVVRRLELAEDPVFNMPTSGGVLKDRFWGAIGAVYGLFSPSSEPAEGRVDEEGLVDRLRSALVVDAVRGTHLLSVSYSSHDPELAARVLGTVLDEFIEQHLEDKYDATAKASGFLYKELQDLKIAVEKSEENMIAYARGNDVVDSDERESINQRKLEDLSNELTKVEAELISKTALYEAIQSASEDNFPEVLEDETLRDLKRRASELARQHAAYSQRYGSEWPEVKQVTLELAEVERQLRTARRRAIENARYEYEVTKNRRDKLREALAAQRQVVDELSEYSIQYNILKREVETNKDLYEGLLQRLKQAGVAAGLRSSNIRLVDDPTLPRGPSSPRKLRGLARAILLGLALGVGLAFLLETFDNTLKTTDDVTQYVGLPALGVIPTFEIEAGADPSQLDDVSSRSLEAYRSLRTSILLSHSGQPPQTILVSSALPGEGKTTTVTNTARVLAQTGARTLMIDLDLRRPSLGKQFRISRRTGMSTFLSGNSDLSSQIRATSVPNLYVVGAGPQAPNPAELIGSQRMLTGLKLLREHFTYVVIDSPPLLEITDALIAAREVDGVLLVAQAGRTPHEAVKKAGERLRFVGAKVLGVVLNNLDTRQLGYGYGYGYSGYYNSEYDDYYKAALPATAGKTRQRPPARGRKTV